MIKIGIDPDVERSGVAEWDGSKLTLHTMTLIELFDFLSENKTNDIQIYIECGWLIKKTNWKRSGKSIGVNERIAERTGANHEIGKQIIKFCEFHNIEFFKIKPSGLGKRYNSKQFQKLTGYDKQTNEEKRDAAFLVWKR